MATRISEATFAGVEDDAYARYLVGDVRRRFRCRMSDLLRRDDHRLYDRALAVLEANGTVAYISFVYDMYRSGRLRSPAHVWRRLKARRERAPSFPCRGSE